MAYRLYYILDFYVTGDDLLGLSSKYTVKTFDEWDAMVAATPGGEPALLESLGITLDLRDGM
jgi:hypothetical protein